MMSISPQKSLMVIDPGGRVAEIECFNRILMRCNLKTTYHLPVLGGCDSLTTQSPQGIIIFGSSASVHDNHSWQQSLSDWLNNQMQAGVPTLGLCYGHQLIAHLYGGKVDFLDLKKQKVEGLREVELKKDIGIKRSGKLVVSHRETVVTMPEGFELFATSPSVNLDGLVHKELPIWTLQPHPETTPGFLKNQKISGVNEEDLTFGHQIVDWFIEEVESRANK